MLTGSLGVIGIGQSCWRFSIIYSCISGSVILGIDLTVIVHTKCGLKHMRHRSCMLYRGRKEVDILQQRPRRSTKRR
ncbi:hypothetical protein BJY01DRAFT_99469 [Aspergillus pseudoustus]|uniref:Uncharacterized protein n=1 Tax=Aspergillus pseudoustus TaxID=1810923 RepID=A0ABR4IY92_9EURO